MPQFPHYLNIKKFPSEWISVFLRNMHKAYNVLLQKGSAKTDSSAKNGNAKRSKTSSRYNKYDCCGCKDCNNRDSEESSECEVGVMVGRIEFKPHPENIVECLLHLAHKGKFTRYQIVKFFYLADREHLRRYGRPITYDRYVAMKNGPVASITYDLLKGANTHGIEIENLPFDLVEIGAHFGISNPKRAVNKDILSKSDIKVLDTIIEEFGTFSFDELWEHTHNHEAYKTAWENRKSLADPMAFDYFFEGMNNQELIVDDLSFSAHGM